MVVPSVSDLSRSATNPLEGMSTRPCPITEEDRYQIALVTVAESLRSRLNINEELSDILLDESIWMLPSRRFRLGERQV